MTAVRRIRRVLRNLFRPSGAERALDDEVQGYLDLLADEKIAAGMTPETARRAARLEMGGTEQVRVWGARRHAFT